MVGDYCDRSAEIGVGGVRGMINEMGHTQKCTPSIACAQNVEASVKNEGDLIGYKEEAAFLEMKTT